MGWLFLMYNEFGGVSTMKNIENAVRFNFLYIDRYSFGRTWVYPESLIPYNMLRYIIKGKAIFEIDKEIIEVSGGQIIYLPQGCRLSCRALDDSFSFYSIRFTASVYYEGGDFLADYYNVKRVTRNLTVEVVHYFEEIYHWVKSESGAKMFRIRGYLELLIAYLIEKTESEDGKISFHKEADEFDLEQVRLRIKKSNVKVDSRIQIVIDYMVLHPTEEYTAKIMCQMAELSESRFRKLFKMQVGKSPSEYLRDIRITTAARKLLVSNDNVNTIAYEVGFDDPNYFIRVFKKSFGLTPRQYRASAKE